MKGFLRGLRCMFDTDDDKEPEIQIGAPTDVKHVAHIGCDGPSTPAPSWMHEYQGETNGGSKDHGSESLSHQHKARQSRRSSHGNESSNHKPRKNRSTNNESSTNVKKTRKKQGDETTRSSKTRNKDPSTNDSG
ncbi:uncharacterized protein LOC143576120 [Bidens hawaiensis]|uniref:uncharacterized protein LOC143576120 n=1 Tax=Bidens hawaiensis TaxID=980011 RepID=UPI00404B9FE6